MQGWTPPKHPPPAHLLRAAASCSPGVSVLAKAAGAAPTESVMPKAGAPMESVMPEAGAAIESVVPEAAPMESVLPDCWRMAKFLFFCGRLRDIKFKLLQCQARARHPY